MTDGLKDKHRVAIIEIIAQNPRIERAVLFGSRAMETFTTTSDVDIALLGAELTIDDPSNIRAEIEELSMPQRADVLIYDNISNEKLRNHIDKHGIVWYEKSDNRAPSVSEGFLKAGMEPVRRRNDGEQPNTCTVSFIPYGLLVLAYASPAHNNGKNTPSHAVMTVD